MFSCHSCLTNIQTRQLLKMNSLRSSWHVSFASKKSPKVFFLKLHPLWQYIPKPYFVTNARHLKGSEWDHSKQISLEWTMFYLHKFKGMRFHMWQYNSPSWDKRTFIGRDKEKSLVASNSIWEERERSIWHNFTLII